MYVYIQTEPSLWTVGFYDPKGTWHTDSDHGDKEAAAKRVAHLNGEGKPERQRQHEGDETPSRLIPNPSQPAFPCDGPYYSCGCHGLTKREDIAARIMAALAPHISHDCESMGAERAVKLADALLAALAEGS